MADLIAALREGPVLADGAMGSYIFRRTGRLSEHGHVYEALNEDNPELIEEIHLAYLRAGARCLKTNTFGANGSVLRAMGEQRSAARLARAGVRAARRAVERYRRMQEGEAETYLLGSVGPTLGSGETPADATRTYREQIDALIDEGVDALLLETFRSLDEIGELLRLRAARFEGGVPWIVNVAFQRDPERNAWNVAPAEFLRLSADNGVAVAGINCCAPWDALAFLDEIDQLEEGLRRSVLVSVMPNAGGFQRIGNRYMTRVNPEFMGGLARTLARRGVRLIGGCCEVHPLHIREMHNYLHGHLAGARPVEVENGVDRRPAGNEEKRLNGPFSQKLKDGAFVVSVEMLPPRGTSPQVLNARVDMVETLADSGLVDAVDITDGSRGIPLMPVADFVAIIRERLGWTPKTGDRLEIVPHFTCRDLNMMGMQARLVGFHAQRLHNILFITGDPPKMSPTYPRSTAVFDADSAAMIRLAHRCLNAGVDFGGQPLSRSGDPRTHFTLGSGFEPEALDVNLELEKLRRKMDAGVDYIMTQPAFRPEPLEALDPYRARVPILVGVLVLKGFDHARRMAEVPGVVVPEALFQRFARFECPRDQARLGAEIAVEQVRRVRREGWAGVYLMSPGSSALAVDVLRDGMTG